MCLPWLLCVTTRPRVDSGSKTALRPLAAGAGGPDKGAAFVLRLAELLKVCRLLHGPLQRALRSRTVRRLHRVSLWQSSADLCLSPRLWFTQADDTRWTARSVTEALHQAVNALPEGPTRRRLQARAIPTLLSARL